MTNPVSEIALGALGDDPLPFYRRVLRRTCEREAPPYGERGFGVELRRLARDPGWFAGLLFSNAELEGDSARQLWNYAAAVEETFAAEMRKHAADEARHSKLFGRLLLRLFPNFDTDAQRRELAALSPALSGRAPVGGQWKPDELLNSVILVNLYEVKALILGKLLAPLLVAYAEPEDRDHIERVTGVLLNDEVEHIRYTARFIERSSRENGEGIEAAFVDFQRELNRMSCEDVEETRLSASR
jgi:hypothetical protein